MLTSQRERNGLRGLMAATIIMGVMIIAGVAILGVTIVRRMSSVQPQPAQTLNEPANTRITAISGAGDRLAVLLTGGGPDRVVLLDPRTGLVSGRIGLAP